MTIRKPLNDQRAEILRVARMHGAQHVRVFGSRARGHARPDSDLDLLIDLEPGRDLLDLVAIKQDLEDLLGLHVDVVSSAGLDGGPGTRRDDACRDGICWPSEGAHDALESRRRRPIRPIDVRAGQAPLRRMEGIDQHNWHPDARRLVLHEGAQLSECPVGVARSLPPSNRDALADTLKVLQSDSASGVLGGEHQLPPLRRMAAKSCSPKI